MLCYSPIQNLYNENYAVQKFYFLKKIFTFERPKRLIVFTDVKNTKVDKSV